MHGSLFELIERTGGISDDNLLRYLFLQICDGLQAVHIKARYAHLDLKLENILIGNDFKLKLCDFGSACHVDRDLVKKYGTEAYNAPEIEDREGNKSYKGIQADIYSLGIILFTMKFGKPPFNIAK